jgi:thiol-disulfide isomerase/thioredoxin
MKTKLILAAFIFMFGCGLFPNTVYAQSTAFAFPYVFSAEDLYGRTVTEKSLGEKEIFFVHYFATWCPPCVRETPDLAVIAKRYGDKVGFIALLDDYQDNKAGAVRLAESAGISFIMVDAGHRDFKTLLSMVQSGYVPTTILIGRDGKVIGEQIVGAKGLGYASFIDRALGR